MLVLLVLSSVLAALVPVERNRLRDESSSTTTTVTRDALPTGELVERSIAADDATPETIKLSLGDQLALTVTSPKLADQVEIPVLGQLEDVDPDFPAHFDMLALERGTFPVRLIEARRVIARIEVGPAGDQSERAGRSKDSPGSSTESSTSGASSPS